MTMIRKAMKYGRKSLGVGAAELTEAIRRARPDIFITPKIIGEFEAGRMVERDGVMLELYRIGWEELQKGGSRC